MEHFVVETKSGLFAEDLRDKESAKIKCGAALNLNLYISSQANQAASDRPVCP